MISKAKTACRAIAIGLCVSLPLGAAAAEDWKLLSEQTVKGFDHPQ